MSGEPHDPLPWQRELWQGLIERRRGERLPHALLLTGPAGLGKLHLARAFAAALLCRSPAADGTACGGCSACKLLAAGTHPDFHPLTPPEESRQIKVDQVRGLCAEMAMKSQFGGFKVALVAPAERMNVNAANGLLKTLEEPPPLSLMMLVSDRPALLPATIRSRCQPLPLRLPPRAEALAWLGSRLGGGDAGLLLDLAGGAPLTALELAAGGRLERRGALFDDFERLALGRVGPLAVAAAWARGEVAEALFWLSGWAADMIRLRAAGAGARLANGDLAGRLGALAEGCATRWLFERHDAAGEGTRLLEGNINAQLLLEELLIPWAGAGRARGPR